MKRKLAIRIWALLLPVLVVAQQYNEPVLPDPGRTSISREQQEQVGLQAMGQVYQQMPVLPDSSPITQYVQQLGRKLVRVIPQDRTWPYQFHVIQQKEVNAFALPGGPLFINIGTIETADNEAQLAGVMAHEMSHVYMQHSAKQAGKSQTLGALAGILGAIMPGNTIGNIARMGIQLGGGLLSLKYSRGDEAQADAVGAIIMYRAGYNPKALADFFQKLEQQGGNSAQILSDHPNPGNREEAIQREVANWPAEQYDTNNSAFLRARDDGRNIRAYTQQEISAGAKNGQWARQNQSSGATPPNLPASSGPNGTADVSNVSYSQVRPSNTFTSLRQNDFAISYPNNWKAGNGQNSILIAPDLGVGQNGIAYGVLIGEGVDRNARDLDQATQDVVQSLQQQNPGMRVSSGMSTINVNGVEARSVYLSGQSPVQRSGRQLAERDWLVTVPTSQGSLMYLVFIAPQNDFGQLQGTYQKMLRSLQVR
jgi:Zn-dependent protease with chaperone function